jgi:hypothetical protein
LFPFEHGNEHSGSIQEAGSLMTSWMTVNFSRRTLSSVELVMF